jgi:hypothetical protein
LNTARADGYRQRKGRPRGVSHGKVSAEQA